ncbi:MAG: ComEC/Rec2 family competence protein [Oscillospiraceae bacterium]|nr:ComEC/Rec2 family competence protein [Oscillospiraceae bacterium]
MSRKKTVKAGVKAWYFVITAALIITALLFSENLIPTCLFCGNSGVTRDPLSSSTDEEILRVTFIDVGQADSILVECGESVMLVDGGNKNDGDTVVSVLKKHGIDNINYMVATHPHEDHVGGLSGVLNYATVKKAYCSYNEYDSSAFRNFKKYLDKQSLEITLPVCGTVFYLGKAKVTIIGPQRLYDSVNDNSIVLKLEYGDTSFLLMGDAGNDAEKDLIESGYDLSADVLKIGHHGSSDATSYVFLKEVMPDIAVISCGKNNDYGHPSESTLSRLADAQAKVYLTQNDGDIIIESDGTLLNVMLRKN